jgi:hypothetical protein
MTYLYSLEVLINFFQLLLQLYAFFDKTFHRTSANFNFINDERQNVCVDLNQISGYSWKIIKTFLCEFEPENYF